MLKDAPIANAGANMPIQVERDEFDLHDGFHYYVSFKPNALEEDDAYSRVPVEVAISVCENGDLADVTFELPKYCRDPRALTYMEQLEEVKYVKPRVFVVRPGWTGDAVVHAMAHLEMDLVGRIVGMDIHWMPTQSAMA